MMHCFDVPRLQSLEREKDAMHEELLGSRKQGADAAAEVRRCQAAAAEHAKAVSSSILLLLPSWPAAQLGCCKYPSLSHASSRL